MRRWISILICAISLSLTAQEAKNEIDFDAEEAARELAAKQGFRFSVSYRIEAGYVQDWQHSFTNSYPDTYFHGAKLGATVDFNLPHHTCIQTGLLYALTYGENFQHWRNVSLENTSPQIQEHYILRHNLLIPVRATYTQRLWRDLALYFYGGPQMAIGLAYSDHIYNNLNPATLLWLEQQNIKTEDYDRLAQRELHRFDIQMGVGLGLQWAGYRFVGGYDFGLNNLVRAAGQHAWDWSWYVGFSYGINYKL